jgi:hypothetical protein
MHLLVPFLLALAHQRGYLLWVKREWATLAFYRARLSRRVRALLCHYALPLLSVRSEPVLAAIASATTPTPVPAAGGAVTRQAPLRLGMIRIQRLAQRGRARNQLPRAPCQPRGHEERRIHDLREC